MAALRRRREREDSGTCLVEGYEELALAMDAGAIPEVVLHCAELMLDPAAQLPLVERARSLGAQTWEVARAAFEKTAYREGPDGFLAVVPTPGLPLAQVTLPPDPLVLLCEGIEKPGNLGAMLRTADAAGIDLVVAVDQLGVFVLGRLRAAQEVDLLGDDLAAGRRVKPSLSCQRVSAGV